MILHLTRDFPPRHSGGLSTAVGGIVRGLRGEGIESRVISFDGWGRKGGKKTDWLPRARSSEQVLRVREKSEADSAASWAATPRPRLVHVHDPFLWPLGVAIAEAAGAPIVHTLHVVSHHQDRLRGLETATRTTAAQAAALAEASAVLAPTPQVATLVCADFPDIADRVRVCRLGLEVPPPRAADAPISGELLFVGRFSDMAGVGELPALLDILGERARVRVVGGLPDNPRAAQRWTETLTGAAAKSGASIRFDGWQDQAALAAILSDASIMIAPNRYATFGFTVAEAMASQIAVCAYRVGGLGDLIESERSGLLVSPAPEALASAAERLLDDDELVRNMGERARERIAEQFSLERAAGELRAAYDSVLG